MIILITIINLLLLMYFVKKNKNGLINSLSKKDKIKNLLILLGIGVGSLVISWLVNTITGSIIDLVFNNCYTIMNDEIIWNNIVSKTLYGLVRYIICVSITEELAKNLITHFYIEESLEYEFTLKTKYDYIIIFLIVSMTFSILENFLYIMTLYKEVNSTGIVRLLTEPIGHIFWAIIFGNYYYKYKIEGKAFNIKYILNKTNKEIEKISVFESNIDLHIKGFIITILLHGIYDFFTLFPLMMIVLIVVYWIFFIRYMVKLKNSELLEDGVNCFMRHQNIYTKDEVIELYLEKD